MPVRLSTVLPFLRRWAVPASGAADDAELVVRFQQFREEAAFAALVQGHGALVYGTCRRLLGDGPDAEDVFQATFLVLARKADSLDPTRPLGDWLYRVARNLALNARRDAQRRRAHEREAAAMQVRMDGDATAQAARELLDAELGRLPSKYRLPLVLCHLQGKTQQQAARELGWPTTSLAARLQRAKELLGDRLRGRGVVLSTGTLVAALAETAPAAPPAALALATVKVALAFAAHLPAAGAGTAKAAVLAEGMLKAMVITRLKSAALVLVFALGLFGAGGIVLAYRAGLVEESAPPAAVPAPHAAGSERPMRTDFFGDPLPDGALFRVGTVRLKHPNDLARLAYVPNQPVLVSLGADYAGTVRLWETATGKEKGRFPNDSRFALSPDGRLLATRTARITGQPELWDIASGKLIAKLPDTGMVSYFKYFADKQTLIDVDDKRVIHWDIGTGKKLREWDHGIDRISESDGKWAVSRNGKILAHVGPFIEEHAEVCEIWVWDLRNGKRLGHWKDDFVHGFKHGFVLAPDGDMLITTDGTRVTWWDTATGTKKRRQEPWSQGGRRGEISLSPDGKLLAHSQEHRHTLIVDALTGAEVRRLDGVHGPFAFSGDGSTLACVDPWHNIQLWDVRAGKRLEPFPTAGATVFNVAFAGGGELLVTREGDSVTLRRSEDGREIRQLPGCRDFLLVPDGKTLIVVSDEKSEGNEGKELPAADRSVLGHQIDLATGKKIRSVPLGKWHGPIKATSRDGRVIAMQGSWWDGKQLRDFGNCLFVEWSPDTERVALIDYPSPDHEKDEDGYFRNLKMRILETSTGKLLCEISGVDSRIWYQTAPGGRRGHQFTPRFSPDNRLVAAATDGSQQVGIWEVATGKALVRLDGNQVQFDSAFCFSPNSKLLALPDAASRVCLYDLAAAKVIRRFDEQKLPRECAQECVFSPDSRLLAALYPDGKVCLWEIASGREVRCWQGSPRNFYQYRPGEVLVFAPNSQKLASVADDCTALVWDVTGICEEGRLPSRRLQPAELEGLWADLAGDARRAHSALWRMVAGTEQTVPFLAKRLQPVAPIDPQQLTKLLADLGSEQFATRHKASAELESLAELAEPAMRRALADKPGLELRQRLERLLILLDEPIRNPDRLRALRSVAILESIGSPEAEQSLKKLAGGARDAGLTDAARAALERLGGAERKKTASRGSDGTRD